MAKKIKAREEDAKNDQAFPGYPHYSSAEDIYSKDVEDKSVNPDDNTVEKNEENIQWEEGDDLDVPGAELDDADEAIGEEDEENNYYSLGGDDHNDLEEDKGD